MNKLPILNVETRNNLETILLRASLVIVFFFFGYAKWFEYEAAGLTHLIANSPLLSWMYSTFGIRGASYVLGVAEWSFGGLLFIGFWFPLAGLLGAAGSVVTFLVTLTLLFTTPGMIAPDVGSFPALNSTAQFLLKDIVLLAASLFLLRAEMRHCNKLIKTDNPMNVSG